MYTQDAGNQQEKDVWGNPNKSMKETWKNKQMYFWYQSHAI